MTREQFVEFMHGSAQFRGIAMDCLVCIDKSSDNADGCCLGQNFWNMYWRMMDISNNPENEEMIGNLLYDLFSQIGTNPEYVSGHGLVTDAYKGTAEMESFVQRYTLT